MNFISKYTNKIKYNINLKVKIFQSKWYWCTHIFCAIVCLILPSDKISSKKQIKAK